MMSAYTVAFPAAIDSQPHHKRLPEELERRLVEDLWGAPFPYLRGWGDGDRWGEPLVPGSPTYGGSYAATGTINDRRGGRNLPVYWSEQDLRSFRILSRFLADTNLFATGFLSRLVDYHIRKGFSWQACRKGAKKTPYAGHQTDDPLVRRAQSLLDQWKDKSIWSLKSREAFRRWRRDGEVFGRFFYGGYGRMPVFRFVEPEQVGSPDAATEGPRSFGIEVDEDDAETILSYFVRDADGDGRDGDWVDADEIIFAKANVDMAVKRGLPDFFPLHELLDGTRRLLRNVLDTSIAQAAVAWREKFPTATAAQVQGLIPQWGQDKQYPMGTYPGNPGVPGWPYGTNQVRGGATRAPGGNVQRVEGNREFEDGPVAAGIPNYLQVEQAVLRGCGARWGMPEYFSGDASNNNFASSLVAGSPFSVAVEGCQLEYGVVFERRVAVKVLELSARAGIITQEEYDALDVEVEEPAVVTADPMADTQKRNIQHTAGVLSATTWQIQDGLDPQHEQANFEQERKAQAAANVAQGLNPDGSPVAQPGTDGGQQADQGGDGSLGQQGVKESEDTSGHQHKGTGPGGGQFTSGSGGGSGGGSKKNGTTASVASKGDFDKAVKASGRELFRGVPQQAHAEQFKTGELRTGKGAYGDGVYVGYGSGGREVAENAAGDEGHMARITLKPDATVESWDDAEEAWKREVKDNPKSDFARLGGDGFKDSAAAVAAFAKSRGVDALDVKHNQFMNILNPAAAIVEHPGGNV